jgi:hypothetical protein
MTPTAFVFAAPAGTCTTASSSAPAGSSARAAASEAVDSTLSMIGPATPSENGASVSRCFT